MIRHLFTFDPGGKCSGWAEFINGQLFACGLSRTKLKTVQGRAKAHRHELTSRGAYDLAEVVLAERMQHRGGKSKGSPQILHDLNLISGHVGTEWVTPAEWKGMVPKDEHQPLILAALTPAERARVSAVMPNSLRHNAVDAVGIGLYYLGRLKKEATWKEIRVKKQLAKSLTKRRAGKSPHGRGTPSTRSTKQSGKGPRRLSFVMLPLLGPDQPS